MSRHRFDMNDGHRFREHNPASRLFFGLGVAVVGILLLLKALGIVPPFVRFSWPLILLVIGGLIGIKNSFRGNAWWILMLIGTAHLIPAFHVMGKSSRHLVWPLGLVIFGLMIAFRPRRVRCRPHRPNNIAHITDDSRLIIDVTFGGRKEIITAKDFKGGDVSVSFGGSEINLTQADLAEDSAMLNFNVSFGSVELIVPSNWEIINEIRPTMGSVEDDRVIHASSPGEVRKKLVLQGNCSFGSIEIKSY
jgi:predicted membrane protein